MFVTINDPAQMRDRRLMRDVRSFVAKKWHSDAKRLQEAQEGSSQTEETSKDSLPHHVQANESQPAAEMIKLSTLRRRDFATSMYSHWRLGRVRIDYIENHYPGERGTAVKHAFEFWSQAYAKAASNVAYREPLHDFCGLVMQTAIVKPVLIEALLAQSFNWLIVGNGTDPPLETLYHRGKALRLLRERIKESDVTNDDGVMTAIVILVALDCVYHDWEALSMNLKALRILLESRGGSRSVSAVYGFPASVHLWAELSYSFYESAKVTAGIRTGGQPLLYPRKGSDEPDLQTLNLPKGFRKMAEQQLLCKDIIQVLSHISVFLDTYQYPLSPNTDLEDWTWGELHLTERLASLLSNSNLTALERVLTLNIIIFVSENGIVGLTRPRGSRQLSPLKYHYEHLERLNGSLPLSEVLVWMALMSAGAAGRNQPIVNQWLLLDRVIAEGHTIGASGWVDVLTIARKFLSNARLEQTWQRCWEDRIRTLPIR